MIEPKKLTHELVGTFTDRRNANEWRRLLTIGCVHNSLGSTEGRVIEEGGLFKVFATKGAEKPCLFIEWITYKGKQAALNVVDEWLMSYDYELTDSGVKLISGDHNEELIKTWMAMYCLTDDYHLTTI